MRLYVAHRAFQQVERLKNQLLTTSENKGLEDGPPGPPGVILHRRNQIDLHTSKSLIGAKPHHSKETVNKGITWALEVDEVYMGCT